MIKNSKGFTLIEMMIVVSIMVIILPIVAKSYHQSLRNREESEFIRELISTLYEAQMTALSSGEYIQVVIDTTSHEVIYKGGNYTNIRTLKYPDSVIFLGGTLGLKLTFTPNGSHQKTGTLFITTSHHDYKLVLLIGQGRFYVEEL